MDPEEKTVTPPVDPPVVDPPVVDPPAEPEPSPMFKSLFEEVTDEPEHIEALKTDYDEIRKFGFETAAQKLTAPDDPEPDPAPKEDPPKEDAPAKEDPPATPIQFSRKTETEKVDPIPEEPKPPAKEPEPVVETTILDTMLPEEREHYDLLKFASEKMGDDFKDADKKFVGFIEAHRKFVADAIAEDEDVTFDADNEEYQKFLRAEQPRLSAAQFKKIEREQIKDEVRRDMEPEFEAQKKKLSDVEKQPKVDKELDSFYDLMDSAVPEEMLKVLKADGEDAARDQFPIEHRYASNLVPRYTAMGKAFIEIDTGLTKFDAKDPTHAMMKDFMDKQIDHVKGSSQAVRDGKQFVGMDEFAKMSAADKEKSWTLTRENQINIFKYAAEADIKAFVKSEYDSLEKAGFKRSGAPTPTPPPPVVEDPPSVKGKPTIAPAGGGGPSAPARSPYAVSILGDE